jgi:small ligand-binding sensory domain FIST
MNPMMAPEMISARVEGLRREGDAKGRRPRGAPRRRRLGLRAALGVRLVSLGCRLLGEPVRIEQAEVG